MKYDSGNKLCSQGGPTRDVRVPSRTSTVKFIKRTSRRSNGNMIFTRLFFTTRQCDATRALVRATCYASVPPAITSVFGREMTRAARERLLFHRMRIKKEISLACVLFCIAPYRSFFARSIVKSDHDFSRRETPTRAFTQNRFLRRVKQLLRSINLVRDVRIIYMTKLKILKR